MATLALKPKALAYHRGVAGFSLIELLVVLTLIALLASIAWPNLRQPIDRAQRTQAGACLLQLGAWIEREARQGQAYAGIDIRNAGIGCARSLSQAFVFKLSAPGQAHWAFVSTDAHRWQLLAQRRDRTPSPNNQCLGLVYRDNGARGVLKADGNVAWDGQNRRQCWH